MKATKKILLSALVSAYCAVSMTGCSQQSDSTSADKKAEITAAQAATPAQEKPDMKDADSNVMPSSTAEGGRKPTTIGFSIIFSNHYLLNTTHKNNEYHLFPPWNLLLQS